MTTPLEAAVLDALNVEDLRDAAHEVCGIEWGDAALRDRLEAAADALAALREAQQ